MKWSLVIGTFWGAEVRLHASMLLLVPYAMFTFRPEGLADTALTMLLIALIFACVALHEMGHTAAARMVGIHVNSIVLWPLGGFANLSRRPTRALHDIFISAAGPLTNLLIFCVLAVLAVILLLVERWMIFPQISMGLWQWRVLPFLSGLMVANLSLALANLLPIYPLDGGQIARNLIKLVFGEKRADQAMLILSLPPSLALTVFGFISGDIALILTGLILLLAVSTLNPRMSNGLVLAWQYVFDRAGYYLRRQDFDPALSAYSKAIERKPNAPGLYVSRAICHMNLIDLAAARKDTDCALALDQKNFIAWTLLGELLALEKAYPEALDAYNKSIALQPNWPIAYLDRGGLYQEQGQLDLALADMNHGVELGPGAGVGHVLRSILHHQMGCVEKAREDAAHAQRFAPHWMLAFTEIFLNNFTGHFEWAVDYYGRAVEQFPGAYQAYQGRADAARANGHPDWAIADYNRAIQLAPKQGELYLARAKAYLALNQPAQAQSDLQQAASIADRAHIRRMALALSRVHFGTA